MFVIISGFCFANEIVWDIESMKQIDSCQLDASIRTSDGRNISYTLAAKLLAVKKNSEVKYIENEYMESKEFFREGSTNYQIFWDAVNNAARELGMRKGDYFQIIITPDILDSWCFNGIYLGKKSVKGDFYTIKVTSAFSDAFFNFIDGLLD